MDVADAAALIAPAVGGAGLGWADLGAGGGTFTRALLELLGPGAHVYAVDRDVASVRALARIGGVTAILGDFREALELPVLDGVLLANALHFVPHREQAGVLSRVARYVRPGGRVVLVEYENRAASRWVPYPVSFSDFTAKVGEAGLGAVERAGERDSAFGGGDVGGVGGGRQRGPRRALTERHLPHWRARGGAGSASAFTAKVAKAAKYRMRQADALDRESV